MSQPTTEFTYCAIHNKMEPYTYGVSYWYCFECGHRWQTQADFQDDVNTLYAWLNKMADAEGVSGSVEPTPNPANYHTTVDCCPLCTHDW